MPNSEPRSRPASVLIAEDDPDIREILAELLSAEGYDVLTAIDGAAALEALEHGRPRLILLDVGMPGLDGPDFCRAYRVSGGTAPVVLITAAAPDAVTAAIAACGAADYIAKPFDIAVVLETVARHTRGQPG